MNFDHLDLVELEKQMKYFNDYYGATFKREQGTEELLDMIHEYSLDGTLIDFGSGSNIFFWLTAFSDITKVHCVDISRESFFINEQIRYKKMNAQSILYPLNKYHKCLDDILMVDIQYQLLDIFRDLIDVNQKYDNVSQFGLLGLCHTKEEYIKTFKKLFGFVQEGGVFLGANWHFSKSYAKKMGFENDYLKEELIVELQQRLNINILYQKEVPIKNDNHYDYVLIYALKNEKRN